MKSLFACGLTFLVLAFSASAQTNEWTKSTSGNWEESYWSLGRLPGTDQQLVAINNDGWKAVAIGADTTASFPQSLSLNNLLIEARTNSSNQLLLNWAGLSVPLLVRSNLTIGTNGSLVSHYSVLVASNACIDGFASFMDFATENFGRLTLRYGATFGLTNGVMTCSNLTFDEATFTQIGGTHILQNMILPEHFSNSAPSELPTTTYYLNGGALTSQHLSVGDSTTFVTPPGHPAADFRHGKFWQTGGVHTNSEIMLEGAVVGENGPLPAGAYRLDGGLFVSGFVDANGPFTQYDGTNLIQELQVGEAGSFGLYGGKLVSSNTTVVGQGIVGNYPVPIFLQTNSVHTVRGRLLVQGGSHLDYFHYSRYELAGGILIASNIQLESTLRLSALGTVSNNSVIRLSQGAIMAYDASFAQRFGKLQVSTAGTLELHDYLYTPTRPSVWRFADSHTLPWTGQLYIYEWGEVAGDHIFFGTNAQGLTPEQLALVTFFGTNGLTYSGALLPTGELVPGVPPLSFTNSGTALVVSWPGTGYELDSATNVIGPYTVVPAATSPFTNTFTDPRLFFRLHLKSP